MNDTINGYPVALFLQPYMNGNDQVDYRTGCGNKYHESDEVPYETWHYNYGKNFAILDTESKMESDTIISHYILNGKVLCTTEMEPTFVDGFRYVTPDGLRILVDSQDDLQNYLHDCHAYMKAWRETQARYQELRAAGQYDEVALLLREDNDRALILSGMTAWTQARNLQMTRFGFLVSLLEAAKKHANSIHERRKLKEAVKESPVSINEYRKWQGKKDDNVKLTNILLSA